MSPTPISALRYFRPAWGRIVRMGLGSLVAAQLETAAIVLLVPLAQVVASGDEEFSGSLGPLDLHASPTQLALLSAGAITLAAVVNTWLAWERSRVTATWELDQRNRIVGDYLSAGFETQASDRLGTLDKLTQFAGQGAIALGAIATGLKAGITVALFLVSALVLDARAALAIVVLGALLVVLLRPAMVRTRKYSRALGKRQLEYSQELLETTRMAREIKVFDARDAFRGHLESLGSRIARIRARAGFVSGVLAPAYQYTAMLFIVGALIAAEGFGDDDVAALGAIALLLLRSISFGQQLQSSYQTVIESVPYLELFESIRTDYLSKPDTDGTIPLERVRRIDLEAVSYSYDGATEALSAVSLSLHAGEIIGVVGPSGGGKSTLTQLLLRLRRPTAGEILVNGIPSDRYRRSSWAAHFSLVPQEPRLFHGTVAENIRFFHPHVDAAAIEEAARSAGIHDVVESLDHGYETLIGPAFRDLSGGQIQRIGIARALVRRADVLVLDEPTSALDAHSEAVIQQTIEGLRGSALVVIVAHRLSTLSACDRILVLRDGAVETIGTLADVAERSPFFRSALEAGTLDIGAPEPPGPPLQDPSAS